MKLIELTMPLDHEYMPEEIFPTSTPFILAPAGHPKKGISLGTETGTCLTLPSQFADYRKTPRLHELTPEKLILRETVVVDLKKEQGGKVTPDDIDRAFTGAEIRSGNAVLLRTGWGDQDWYQRPGARYMLNTPHFSAEGAIHLARHMQEQGSDLMLTDMALIALPEKHLIPEWLPMTPRPEPWPSAKAEGYLQTYTPEKMAEDYAAALSLAEARVMTVKRLVNCGAIKSTKIRVIVGPLNLVRGVGSTCRVVAIED